MAFTRTDEYHTLPPIMAYRPFAGLTTFDIRDWEIGRKANSQDGIACIEIRSPLRPSGHVRTVLVDPARDYVPVEVS